METRDLLYTETTNSQGFGHLLIVSSFLKRKNHDIQRQVIPGPRTNTS